MLLKIAKDDPGGPFLTMKIVELEGMFLMEFIDLFLAFIVMAGQNAVEKLHPL